MARAVENVHCKECQVDDRFFRIGLDEISESLSGGFQRYTKDQRLRIVTVLETIPRNDVRKIEFFFRTANSPFLHHPHPLFAPAFHTGKPPRPIVEQQQP